MLMILRTGMRWNALNATGIYNSSSALQLEQRPTSERLRESDTSRTLA